MSCQAFYVCRYDTPESGGNVFRDPVTTYSYADAKAYASNLINNNPLGVYLNIRIEVVIRDDTLYQYTERL
jgi:hypothetical protein